MFQKNGITYRVGNATDAVGLTMFLSHIADENEITGVLETDLVKVKETIQTIVESDKGAVLLATKLDKSKGCDIIVGALVLGETYLWWSNKRFFTNVALRIDPKYRKNYDIQRTILWFAKKFSRDTQVPILISIFDKSSKKEALERYFRINGFETIGFSAVYQG